MDRVMRECPHPNIRKRPGSSYCLTCVGLRAYGATSERKCLASFSIRFN
jgi:hypothetical protein